MISRSAHFASCLVPPAFAVVCSGGYFEPAATSVLRAGGEFEVADLSYTAKPSERAKPYLVSLPKSELCTFDGMTGLQHVKDTVAIRKPMQKNFTAVDCILADNSLVNFTINLEHNILLYGQDGEEGLIPVVDLLGLSGDITFYWALPRARFDEAVKSGKAWPLKLQPSKALVAAQQQLNDCETQLQRLQSTVPPVAKKIIQAARKAVKEAEKQVKVATAADKEAAEKVKARLRQKLLCIHFAPRYKPSDEPQRH